MQFTNFVGIDVSKDTLDYCLFREGKVVSEFCAENSVKGVAGALKELESVSGFSISDTIFCMENTGLYNNNLTTVLMARDCFLWIEKAIQIKRSSGLQRGKSDKVDAKRIALFAFRNQDQAKRWSPKRTVLLQLQRLTSVRDRLLLARDMLAKPIQECKQYDSKEVFKSVKDASKKSLNAIKADIKDIENKIIETIKSDPSLKHLFDLVTSVHGIGPVVASQILITTNEFKDINDGKKYACYCGVVPFEHSSGSSIRGRERVSHFANKKVKKLLHLAAVSIIRHKGEIKDYWERKIKEGKHKMVILNAIRNKLIQRVFAVVKRGSKYDRIYTNPLA